MRYIILQDNTSTRLYCLVDTQLMKRSLWDTRISYCLSTNDLVPIGCKEDDFVYNNCNIIIQAFNSKEELKQTNPELFI